MTTTTRHPEIGGAELKKAGLKATLPRLKILSILEDSKDRHMTAEDVYKHLLEAGEQVVDLGRVGRGQQVEPAADLRGGQCGAGS